MFLPVIWKSWCENYCKTINTNCTMWSTCTTALVVHSSAAPLSLLSIFSAGSFVAACFLFIILLGFFWLLLFFSHTCIDFNTSFTLQRAQQDLSLTVTSAPVSIGAYRRRVKALRASACNELPLLHSFEFSQLLWVSNKIYIIYLSIYVYLYILYLWIYL